MTIENEKLYLEGIWDWAILDGCFGDTKIKPTDIDGFIERNGKFLVIETKKVGVPVKDGQLITFKSLIKTGAFSVLIVWGERNKPEKILKMTRNGTVQFENSNLEKLREIVSNWFIYANSNY